MDFDSSLFDLPFEDLASLSVEPQQQQGQPASASPLDFQDFCSEFAGSDFSADPSAPAWFPEPTPVPAGSPTTAKEAIATMKAEDLFLDDLDKAAFDPLGFDSSYQGMFNYGSPNGDAQVVPDMTPVDANAADFTLPTFSQTSAVPKSTTTGQLPAATMPPPTQPYSWMNGLDYSSFGWPVRARLPSKQLAIAACAVAAFAQHLLQDSFYALEHYWQSVCVLQAHPSVLQQILPQVLVKTTKVDKSCCHLQVILLLASSLSAGTVTRKPAASITAPRCGMRCAR